MFSTTCSRAVKPTCAASCARAAAARRIDEVLRKRNATVEVVAGSLASVQAAAKLVEGVDVVYHVAAALKGQPADMFANTVVASKNLLEGMVRQGRPIQDRPRQLVFGLRRR